MAAHNQFSLIGYLGRIETRTTQSGTPYTLCSVCVEEERTIDGELLVKRDWFRFVAWGADLGQRIQQHKQARQRVQILGKLELRTWTDTATRQPRTELQLKCTDIAAYRREQAALDQEQRHGPEGGLLTRDDQDAA